MPFSGFCRRPAPDDEANESVLIDGNELAGDSPFFALGVVDVSPDHHLLAFSTDYDGNESFTLRFKDLDTREVLSDSVTGTYYGSAWGTDNATFFYTTIDEAHRPYRLWRHRLGTPSSDDELVYEETDERFFLGVELTRSEGFVVVDLSSKVTTEVRILDAAHPDAELQVFEPRRQGVEYSIDHQGDRFLVLHNDGALNFELALLPRVVRATMQTTAMRARRSAYSTRAAPRSVLPKRARR